MKLEKSYSSPIDKYHKLCYNTIKQLLNRLIDKENYYEQNL